MPKIVINACFGGFGLSPAATLELYKRNPGALHAYSVADYFGKEFGVRHGPALREWTKYLASEEGAEHNRNWSILHIFSPDLEYILYARDVPRDDPDLIQLLEDPAWGPDRVSGICAQLRIVEIPDGIPWVIEEYDGNEHVAEAHRVWS